MNYNKLIQHFHSNGHDFNRDAKLNIIEIEKNTMDNITMITETYKDKWIKHLQTLTSNGFNIKLNYPQNTTLK